MKMAEHEKMERRKAEEKALKADEENSNMQQETMARLVTENKVTLA